ncbi:MAG: DUF4116 domain-containing protein [Candidatus Paceibacterota bacterium]|jgi:hypothetical protein
METLKEEKIESYSREEILEAVKNDRYVLVSLPPNLQDDAEIVRAAISLETLCGSNMNGPVFKYASPRLRSKRNMVLEAVKNYGEAIEYASPSFDDDKEIVLTALENSWVDTYPYGGSIIYACISRRLREDSKVIEAMGFVKESNLLIRLMTWKENRRKREEWWQEKYGVINKERLEQWKRDVAKWQQYQNSNQNENYSKLRKEIEQMPQYEIWRQAVLEKFGRKCAVCGSTENLEVDHRYKSFYAIIKEYDITNIIQAYECPTLWNVNNGAPLCKIHHDKTTSSVYRNLKQKLI